MNHISTSNKARYELRNYVNRGVYLVLELKSHWYKSYWFLHKCYIVTISSLQIDPTIIERVKALHCTLCYTLLIKLAQISWSTKEPHNLSHIFRNRHSTIANLLITFARYSSVSVLYDVNCLTLKRLCIWYFWSINWHKRSIIWQSVYCHEIWIIYKWIIR